MDRFKSIDEKLENLSVKLGAKLTKDRPEYLDTLQTFEERRIDWIDAGIFKAIIIQPTFECSGVNDKLWNLINIAWSQNERFRPKWKASLVYRQGFDVIETNIDVLLMKSESNLISIQQKDLKWNW